VISAVTGAHLVLIVTEPTVSGLHDLHRVAELATHFNIPTAACINKYDLNHEMSDKIQTYCRKTGIRLLGTVPYDPVVSRALVEKKVIVEYGNGTVSHAIKEIWINLAAILDVHFVNPVPV
jgi:MinD superfamily P-loop ATPase